MASSPGRVFIEQAAAYEGDDCLPWPFGMGPNGYPGWVYMEGVRQGDASR